MNLTTLNVADFKKILGLMKEKEILLSQIAKINGDLAAFDDAEPAKAAKAKPDRKSSAKPKAKRAARGSVKAATIGLLKQAGTTGITVNEIAAKLGASYGQVYTWFQTTGKRIKEIRKMGPAKFGWVGTTPTKAAAVVPVEPKPVAPAKPVAANPAKAPKIKKAKSAKPATTVKADKAKAKPAQAKKIPSKKPAVAKEAVIELVKQSSKAGVTVKEIAAKLQVDSQRIYVWFNSTGKNVKAIKKIAPAKYAWVG